MRLLPAVILALAATPAFAGGLDLSLDEVRTVSFPTAVSTVYVGNPSIADINMIDSRHAFVQGKGYGQTNIIALNKNGNQIANTRVSVVGASNGETVVLNRGAQRVTYSCLSGRCEPVPVPGDGKDAFADASGQAAAHQSTARSAASGN